MKNFEQALTFAFFESKTKVSLFHLSVPVYYCTLSFFLIWPCVDPATAFTEQSLQRLTLKTGRSPGKTSYDVVTKRKGFLGWLRRRQLCSLYIYLKLCCRIGLILKYPP